MRFPFLAACFGVAVCCVSLRAAILPTIHLDPEALRAYFKPLSLTGGPTLRPPPIPASGSVMLESAGNVH